MINKRNHPDREDDSPANSDHTDAPFDEALRETLPTSDPTAIRVLKENAMTATTRTPAEATIHGGESVFVEQVLVAARARLVTIADDAPLREAARLLHAGIDLVVVCGAGGAVVGVITKTDVVARIGQCQGAAACAMAAALVMSTDVLQCTSRDLVRDVWSKMKARDMKNVPIADAEGRPIGVLNARDALGVLLQDVKYEESLLRDYVMGVGYR